MPSISKTIHNPTVPFYYHDFRLARSFTIHITGNVPQIVTEFISINLAHHCKKKFPLIELPFHLSIRPVEGELVRNSYSKNGWDKKEERDMLCGDCPVNRGEKFNLTLHNDTKMITGIVNDKVAFQFKHRQDSDDIHLFEMHGSVTVDSIRFDFD